MARRVGIRVDRRKLNAVRQELERVWLAERAALVPLIYGEELLVRRPWIEGAWESPLSLGPFDEIVVSR